MILNSFGRHIRGWPSLAQLTLELDHACLWCALSKGLVTLIACNCVALLKIGVSNQIAIQVVVDHQAQWTKTQRLSPVCEITFEKWAETLSGHDKVSMDMDRIVWT